MHLWFFTIISSSFSILPIAPVQAGPIQDNCVICHEAVQSDAMAGHLFSDWKNSVHGKRGVSCQACHGGSPEAQDPAQAHQGILRSTDKKSPLYFTRIPETCGKCHLEILKQFKKSAHYNELERTGRGPNCLTCHGSMATWVLQPDQMAQTCSLCHSKPTQAQAALTLLRLAQSTVQKLAASAPGKSADPAMAALKKELTGVIQLWHTFDTAQVMEQSRRIIKRAHEISTDWKLKSGEGKQDKPK